MDWSVLNRWVTSAFDQWSVVIYAFFIILAVLVVNTLLNKALSAMTRRAHTERHVWKEAFLAASNPPLRGAIWIAGLSTAVRQLVADGNFSLLSEIFPPVRDLAVIGIAAWFLLRAVGELERNIQHRALHHGHEVDQTAIDAIGKLVRAAIVITAILVAMQALGFSISGLLAFGGIGGIAVGFAAQGLVANLFGGLTVYASRPFKVGEWIIMPENNVDGEVQQIGWRATKIMGFDRRPFFVPNALFNTAVLINHSRMASRRIMEYVHLRYCDIDKVPDIVAETNRMLGEHPGIEHEFYLFRFDTCGEFALKLYLYAFTVSTDYVDFMVTKEDILLKIADIIRAHGGELAVPTSTVHVPDGLALRAAGGNDRVEMSLTGRLGAPGRA